VFRARRPLLRAAAVGGTAYAVGKRAQRRSDQEAYQEQRLDDLEAQQAYAPPQQAYAPPPPAASSGNVVEQLERLAALHESGALTDAEFEVQKAKLLR
jgi:hypothetical protein